MDDYKKDVKEEQNIQPLSDDYIKFIRFAQWKIEQAGQGIIGYITNNSYLSGIIHRGMRHNLLQTFDEIYVLNLHGSSRIGERAPDGGADKNVFDIQQGVAIILLVKTTKEKDTEGTAYYADVYGLRGEKHKYLLGNDVSTTEWQKLELKEPHYFFVPKEFREEERWQAFWKLKAIFNKSQAGLMTGQDDFFVDTNSGSLKARILTVFNKKTSNEELSVLYKLNSQAGAKLLRVRAKLTFAPESIKPYSYRPFDTRYIYSENKFLWRSVEELQNFFIADNVALITTRLLSSFKFRHAFASETIGDYCLISNRTKEVNYYFPLYSYPAPLRAFKGKLSDTEALQTRQTNFKPEFLTAIQEAFGKEPLPEEIFYYIYGILYSNIYRQKYEEFLQIDFPRIPLASDYQPFQKVSEFGKELVELHLLKSPLLSQPEGKYPVMGTDKIEKRAYEEKTSRVFINSQQYFEGIPKEVWEYRIGSYQVLDKWLKERKGRSLSPNDIEHYLKVITVVKHTISLQQQIDKLYPSVEESPATIR